MNLPSIMRRSRQAPFALGSSVLGALLFVSFATAGQGSGEAAWAGPFELTSLSSATPLGSEEAFVTTPSPSKPAFQTIATGDGNFSYRDDPLLGSIGLIKLNRPSAGMNAAPVPKGYWLIATDDGMYSLRDGRYFDARSDNQLNKAIVDMTATPSGHGYWLAAPDGDVFAFGDAKFAGSALNIALTQPIAAIGATPSGQGYWLVAADGGVFPFGDAKFFGSAVSSAKTAPIVDIASTPTGNGYKITTADGKTLAFGDAIPKPKPVARPSRPRARVQLLSAGQAGTGEYLGEFVVTCYALPGQTASGRPVSEDVIATDPRVIPMNSKVTIAGLGTKVAGDTGGDIQGKRIDIWKPSAEACRQFGRRTLSVWRA